jgi:hypothetical protein
MMILAAAAGLEQVRATAGQLAVSSEPAWSIAHPASAPERAKAVIPRPIHPRLHAVLLCPLCPFSFLILIGRFATLEL